MYSLPPITQALILTNVIVYFAEFMGSGLNFDLLQEETLGRTENRTTKGPLYSSLPTHGMSKLITLYRPRRTEPDSDDHLAQLLARLCGD